MILIYYTKTGILICIRLICL